MERVIKNIFCLLILFFVCDYSFAKEDEIFLIIGKPKNISFKYKIRRVDIGDPGVCNFHREGSLITLIPLKEGKTQLTVYDIETPDKERDIVTITVFSKDLKKYVSDLKVILKDIEGITISIIETQVFIKGEVFFQEDIDTINTVIKNTPFVVNLVELSRNAQRIMAKKIEREISKPEVSVEPYKNKMVLKGWVYSKEQAENARKTASLYWPENQVVDLLEIRIVKEPPRVAKTIQISTHYIELSKALNKNFLFKWTPFPSAQAQGQLNFNPQTGSSQFSGFLVTTFENLLPRFNYMKSLGIVRVLENPIVSVKSGETADIFSGSTVLIPLVQPTGATTFDPLQIGTKLTIKAETVKTNIDLKVDVSISALGSPTSTGMVNIDQSSISTRQLVENGESIVIGGILRTSTTDIKDRQPGDIEANAGLFTFFKTQDDTSRKTQFIIFVTATTLDSSKDANKELKDYFNLYEVYPSK